MKLHRQVADFSSRLEYKWMVQNSTVMRVVTFLKVYFQKCHNSYKKKTKKTKKQKKKNPPKKKKKKKKKKTCFRN